MVQSFISVEPPKFLLPFCSRVYKTSISSFLYNSALNAKNEWRGNLEQLAKALPRNILLLQGRIIKQVIRDYPKYAHYTWIINIIN